MLINVTFKSVKTGKRKTFKTDQIYTGRRNGVNGMDCDEYQFDFIWEKTMGWRPCYLPKTKWVIEEIHMA